MALLQEILVPLLAVNDTTLTVVELPCVAGAAVKKGEVILVLETSKTSYDVEAPVDGYIQYCCEAERDYAVNEVIARLYSEVSEASAPVPGRPRVAKPVVAPAINGQQYAPSAMTPPVQSRRAAATPAHWGGETLFSYEAERLIEAAGLARETFAGRDLVTGADVQQYLNPVAAPGARMAAPTAATPTAAALTAAGTATSLKAVAPVDPSKAIVQKLQSAKRREIEYLSDIQSTGLTSTLNTHIEMEGIFPQLNKGLGYLKDSLLPVIVYETARMLAGYPLLNAYFTGDAVAVYKEVNPGFAIDIDKGLKVLKLEGAGGKSLRDIEADILRLSGAYLDDTLTVEQLTDITFTITDLSAEGVAFFRPLINKMNSAILGVSAIDEKLQRCTFSLSFDHRVTEGKYVAGFLRELKERIESYRGDAGGFYTDISCFKCYKTLKEDLGGTGFVRCITPEGKEGYVCQSCLKGF
ncbi:2-oxo acid dehydrogenase subunit E2 [Puia sp.]|uniref:2-oxo acid dehydrogenase subunit E2 n=1 Tax=Puia sp. TaxID=2045100 RepID=UPI002F3F2FA7